MQVKRHLLTLITTSFILAIVALPANLYAVTFSTADLVGTWFFHNFSDLPTFNNPGWTRGTITINSSGTVTGGSFVNSNGFSASVAGGLLSMNPAGEFFGSISIVSGGITVTVTISHGKADISKTIVAFVGSNSQGFQLTGTVIKAGGSFSTNDLAGTWFFFDFFDLPSTNDPGWKRGTITINSSGTVTGGSFVDSDGLSRTITGGSLSINSSGEISGSVTDSSGTTSTISQGKMDISKTIVTFVGIDNENFRYMGTVIRAEPVVTIEATDPSAAEPSDPGFFTVSLSKPVGAPVTVFYTTSGTATPGTDYQAFSGSVTIPAGSTSTTITVTPIDDSLVESDESVIVTLDPGSDYIVGSPNRATVTIADNDVALPTVSITATDPTATEAGPTTGLFTVSRTGSTVSPLPVNYTVSGTATVGTDYQALSGSVTIPAGSTLTTITVTPIDDSLVEPDETVTVTLSLSTGYTVGSPSSVTVTIINNDFTLTVTKGGSGDGTVTSNPTGINCGSDCTEVFDSGTSVTLTATADPGSSFAGFSGDADCSDGVVTMNANRDCTATFSKIFTDDPLIVGVTVIKRVHIADLREAVNQLRARGSLGSFSFTDPTLTAGITTVKRVHITELRTALTEAAVALGKSAPNFPTDPTIVAEQTVIKRAHIRDLRSAVRDVE